MGTTDHTGLLTGYEEFVKQTAFFPQSTDRERWGYLGTATGGEAGELLNEIKKLLRDDGGVMTSARQTKILEEAGDVLWYLTAVVNAAGGRLVDVIDINVDKLTARGNLAKTATAERRYAVSAGSGNVVLLTAEQYADHVAAQEHNARLEAELGGI